MRPILKFIVLALPSLGLFLISCKKDISSIVVTPSKSSIIANAGNDLTIELPTDSIILNGTASTGPIRSFQWTKLTGDVSYIIKDPSAAQTAVTNLKRGSFVFELKITGDNGIVARDSLQVNVLDSTINGRELTFTNLVWEYDVDGGGNLYAGIENRPDLFSTDRVVTVFLKPDNENTWFPVEKFHYPNSPGYVYSVYSNCLFLFISPHVFPWSGNTQLQGTKFSIKVRFA